MKAITTWQPHASLIAIGAKPIESRSWRTQYRGPLAIHAAKRFPEPMRRLAYHTEPFKTVLGRAHLIPTQSYGMTKPASASPWLQPRGAVRPEDLPCGAVLCVIRLIDIRPIEALLDMRPHLSEQERAFGDYSQGRFGG